MHKSKSIGAFVLAAVLLFGVSVTGTASAVDKVYKGRFSCWQPEGDIRSVYATKFADLVRQKSNGRVEFTMFYSGALYTIATVIPSVGKGAVEKGLLAGGTLTSFIDEYAMESTWYMLTPDQVLDVWEKTDAGKAVTARADAKLNIKSVGRISLGGNAFFSITSVKTLEDFKGRKVRYLSKTEIPFLKALGMSYVSISTEEVYQGLQAKMVDGLMTGINAMSSFSWWDFAKFCTHPYNGSRTAVIGLNATWFNGLPKDLQQIVLDAGRQITDDSRKGIMDNEKVLYDRYAKEKGGVIYTLPKEEIQRVQQAMFKAGAYDEARKMMGEALWNAAIKVSGARLQ